jgi:hypothetical protein
MMTMMFVPDLGIGTLAGARRIAKVNHVVQNPAVVGQFGEIEIRHNGFRIEVFVYDPVFADGGD